MKGLLIGILYVLTLILPPEEQSLISAGDTEFLSINYDAAISFYHSALALQPGNADIHWRLARVLVAAGEVAPRDQREEIYREAESYARHCVEIDASKAEGHTWLAAALGNRALFVGGKTKIQLANEIKKELDRALAIRSDDDATWSILGSYYFTVGSVTWLERQMASIFLGSIPEGGFEDSEAAFLRAIELSPGTPRHRFELGKLYLDWGREEDGRRMLESALSLPITAAGDTAARRVTREILDNKND